MAKKKTSKTDLPKWQTLQKVTVLLTDDQKDAIDELTKKIMRFRQAYPTAKEGEEKERITSNSIVRALLDNFLDKVDLLELESINNENDLKEWLRKLFRKS